jgi:hypothetical protein
MMIKADAKGSKAIYADIEQHELQCFDRNLKDCEILMQPNRTLHLKDESFSPCKTTYFMLFL